MLLWMGKHTVEPRTIVSLRAQRIAEVEYRLCSIVLSYFMFQYMIITTNESCSIGLFVVSVDLSLCLILFTFFVVVCVVQRVLLGRDRDKVDLVIHTGPVVY